MKLFKLPTQNLINMLQNLIKLPIINLSSEIRKISACSISLSKRLALVLRLAINIFVIILN